MTNIQLQETQYDKNMRYRFLNADDHPLSKSDYSTLKGKYLTYFKPDFDEEYSDPFELSLLLGDIAYEQGYFFSEDAPDKLKSLGYDLDIDTLTHQKTRKKEKQRLHQMHALRQSLASQIFRFIQEKGYRPEGTNHPKGKEIEDPSTRNGHTRIYGGGKWFVIGDEKIWAVRNNGADGDCWAYNNVSTGGAGAIGWWIPYNKYIEKKIELTTHDIETLSETDLTFKEPVFTKEEQEQIDHLCDKAKQNQFEVRVQWIKDEHTKKDILKIYKHLLKKKVIYKSWSKEKLAESIAEYELSA